MQRGSCQVAAGAQTLLAVLITFILSFFPKCFHFFGLWWKTWCDNLFDNSWLMIVIGHLKKIYKKNSWNHGWYNASEWTHQVRVKNVQYFITKYLFRGKNLVAPIIPVIFPPGGTNLLSLPGWNLETMGWNVWNVQILRQWLSPPSLYRTLKAGAH